MKAKIHTIINMPNKQLAYHLLRFTFGACFALHGAVRLPKLTSFAEGMASQFGGTILAGFPSLSFAYVIPFAEVITGLMMIAGGKVTRVGLVLGMLTMGGIMIGTCMIEKWELLTSQLVHTLAFYILLINPYTASGSKME